jgi:hypothetical protein
MFNKPTKPSFGQQFRQTQEQARQAQAQARGPGGRPGGKFGNGEPPLWAQRADLLFEPTSERNFDRVRLVAGNYSIALPGAVPPNEITVQKPAWDYVVHGQMRADVVCSGGAWHRNREHRRQCHGCMAYYNKRKKVSKFERIAWCVLHIAPHQLRPKLRYDGTPVITKTGNNVEVWQAVAKIEKGKDVMPGRMKYWALSPDTANTLLNSRFESIEDTCLSCKHKLALHVVLLNCGNPACDNELADAEAVGEQEIRNLGGQNLKCDKCNHFGLPVEFLRCDYCDNPVRTTPFDVDLLVRTKIEKDYAKTRNDGSPYERRIVTIVDVSEPYALPPELQRLAIPLDLPRLLGPDTLDEQIRTLKLDHADLIDGPGPGDANDGAADAYHDKQLREPKARQAAPPGRRPPPPAAPPAETSDDDYGAGGDDIPF